MKEFESKYGIGDVVVIILDNIRIFGTITAIKFEKDIIKYDVQTERFKLYDIQEYFIEIPAAHLDTTEIQ